MPRATHGNRRGRECELFEGRGIERLLTEFKWNGVRRVQPQQSISFREPNRRDDIDRNAGELHITNAQRVALLHAV